MDRPEAHDRFAPRWTTRFFPTPWARLFPAHTATDGRRTADVTSNA